MRRIAAMALTAATLVAGVGLTASPAEAAWKKNFTVKNNKKQSWTKVINVKGAVARSGKKTAIAGTISDSKCDKWAPGLIIRAYRADGSWVQRGGWVSTYKNGVLQGPAACTKGVKFKENFTGAAHVYIRETGHLRSNPSKTYAKGPWTKLY